MFVLQFPPLVEAGFGRRLLLHFALIGQFGGTLRAEVSGDVSSQPPLRGKCGVAAPHHTLQEDTHRLHCQCFHSASQVLSGEQCDFISGGYEVCVCPHLEGLVPAVSQHVSLQPALTGGPCVVHLTALPQTHKHLRDMHTHTQIVQKSRENIQYNVILFFDIVQTSQRFQPATYSDKTFHLAVGSDYALTLTVSDLMPRARVSLHLFK